MIASLFLWQAANTKRQMPQQHSILYDNCHTRRDLGNRGEDSHRRNQRRHPAMIVKYWAQQAEAQQKQRIVADVKSIRKSCETAD
jgi:hypothetical protein